MAKTKLDPKEELIRVLVRNGVEADPSKISLVHKDTSNKLPRLGEEVDCSKAEDPYDCEGSFGFYLDYTAIIDGVVVSVVHTVYPILDRNYVVVGYRVRTTLETHTEVEITLKKVNVDEHECACYIIPGQ